MYEDNQNDLNRNNSNADNSNTENTVNATGSQDTNASDGQNDYSSGNDNQNHTSYRMNKDSIKQDYIPTQNSSGNTSSGNSSENGSRNRSSGSNQNSYHDSWHDYSQNSYEGHGSSKQNGFQSGYGRQDSDGRGAGSYGYYNNQNSGGYGQQGYNGQGSGSYGSAGNGYNYSNNRQQYSYESGNANGSYQSGGRKMNRRQRRAGGFRGSGQNNGRQPQRWKHLNVFAKSAICAVIIGAIGGGMIFGSFALGRNVFGTNSASISTTTDSLDEKGSSSSSSSGSSGNSSGSAEYSVSQIASKCTDSVVAITNKGVTETQDLFGQTYSQESTSAGSGVIIGKSNTELLIVTNYHVIEDSNKLTVCFEDSKDAVYSANIKGTDSKNDLAVVAVKLNKIDSDVLDKVKIATIGDSNTLKVGEQVVAIGNALGYGQSVTSGYVSALNREVSTSNGNSAKLLQTDAAINPGNSGGALFNMKGELVGINTAKYSDTSVEGMGFAIPISTAKSDIKKLMNETTRNKLSSGYGYLGIYGQDVDSNASESYNIPTGVYVSEVIKNSAAEKAGIQKGDVIVEFGGNTIDSMEDLQERLQYYKAGEKVKMTYSRNSNGTYKEHAVTVTLGNEKNNTSSRKSSGNSSNGSGNSGNSGSGSYGYGGSEGYGSGNSGDSADDFFSQFFE